MCVWKGGGERGPDPGQGRFLTGVEGFAWSEPSCKKKILTGQT